MESTMDVNIWLRIMGSIMIQMPMQRIVRMIVYPIRLN